MLVALGEQGVKTRDDLADLAGDELRDIVPAGTLREEEANAIIMAARAHWFADEDDAGEAAAEDGVAAEEDTASADTPAPDGEEV